MVEDSQRVIALATVYAAAYAAARGERAERSGEAMAEAAQAVRHFVETMNALREPS